MSEVFTPMDEYRSMRYRFNKEDVEFLPGYDDRRGLGKKGQVRIEGKLYDVFGAACELGGCQCDAYIKEVQSE